MIQQVSKNPYLLSLCEHYDILDKIILFADPDSDIRVRLHVFLPGYIDRPHNHRWNYCSLILRGKYKHYIYHNPESNKQEDSFEITKLIPSLVRTEKSGNYYILHNNMIHSVVAEPYTVSLVIRGPSVKNSFFIADKETGESWWQHSAKYETEQEKVSKKMTNFYFNKLLLKLKNIDII